MGLDVLDDVGDLLVPLLKLGEGLLASCPSSQGAADPLDGGRVAIVSGLTVSGLTVSGLTVSGLTVSDVTVSGGSDGIDEEPVFSDRGQGRAVTP